MLGVLALAGCGSEKLVPYLGKWTGSFEPDSPKSPYRMGCNLQLYATGEKFRMRVEGPQQAIEVNGTWTIKRQTILLAPREVKIDDFGGVDLRNPNLPYLPAEAIQKAFGTALACRLSRDNKTATSISLNLGPVEGTLQLRKGNLGR